LQPYDIPDLPAEKLDSPKQGSIANMGVEVNDANNKSGIGFIAALNGPFTLDLRNTLDREIREAAMKNDWPMTISASLIGSCMNSSYEDMTRCASLL